MCRSHLLTLPSLPQSLFGNPILIGRCSPPSFCCRNELENLLPNGAFRIIMRMNADSQERFVFQQTKKRCVPTATDRAAPRVVNAVNQGSGRKYISGTEIADGSQARGVFQLGVGNRALCFIPEQPRRRDKPSRLQSLHTEFISRCRDSAQRFLIAQIVKLAFVPRVKSGPQLVAQTFFGMRWTFVKIAVDHNFVSVGFQASKPRHELAVPGEKSLMMVIRDYKN